MNVAVENILDWLPSARSGDVFIYHVGHLAEDRCGFDKSQSYLRQVLEGGVRVPKDPRRYAVEIEARAAFSLHEQGKVFLTQKRLGYCRFEYRATKI